MEHFQPSQQKLTIEILEQGVKSVQSSRYWEFYRKYRLYLKNLDITTQISRA